MSDQRDVTEPEVYSSLGTAMKFLALDALLQDLVDATADVDSVSVTITLNVGGVPVIGPKTKEYVRGRAGPGRRRCRIAPVYGDLAEEERCVGCGRTPSEGIGCSSCPGYNDQGYPPEEEVCEWCGRARSVASFPQPDGDVDICQECWEEARYVR